MEIYYKDPETARAAGEIELYRKSTEENRRARLAIDNAIKAHFDGWRLPDAAVAEVLDVFDAERVALVLATTARELDHDGRISRDNKTWAAGVRIPDKAPDAPFAAWFICRSHPAILDGYITKFRRMTAK